MRSNANKPEPGMVNAGLGLGFFKKLPIGKLNALAKKLNIRERGKKAAEAIYTSVKENPMTSAIVVSSMLDLGFFNGDDETSDALNSDPQLKAMVEGINNLVDRATNTEAYLGDGKAPATDYDEIATNASKLKSSIDKIEDAAAELYHYTGKPADFISLYEKMNSIEPEDVLAYRMMKSEAL